MKIFHILFFAQLKKKYLNSHLFSKNKYISYKANGFIFHFTIRAPKLIHIKKFTKNNQKKHFCPFTSNKNKTQ